jgi:hypothetical protein
LDKWRRGERRTVKFYDDVLSHTIGNAS